MKLNCQFIDNFYLFHLKNAEQSVVIQITCNNSLVIEGKTYYFCYFTLNYLDAWPFQFSLRFQSNFSEANRYFKIESDTKGDDVLRFQITICGTTLTKQCKFRFDGVENTLKFINYPLLAHKNPLPAIPIHQHRKQQKILQ